MSRKHGWLISLVVVTLLVAACGPTMVTPTTKVDGGDSPTAAPAGNTPAATQVEEPTSKPASSPELPVDADDWHVLGSPDAPVTIYEYSEFQ
ncbi:MAG: hypothetical protein PVH17_10900 [Anaerolineae bacterium]|jgi:hypothetical protein